MAIVNNYKKPLYPKEWPAIAFRIKQEGGWKCRNCGIHQGEDINNNITVHHIDYNTFNNDDTNLVVLCQKCHLCRHGHERAQQVQVAKLVEQLAAGQLQLSLQTHQDA